MRSYFEERGGTYTEVNGVLVPNLIMDNQAEGEIGVWGWRRKRFLKVDLSINTTPALFENISFQQEQFRG